MEWIDAIKRASLVNGPNMIHVKIDPVNSTKVITFFLIMLEKKGENEENKNFLPKE